MWLKEFEQLIDHTCKAFMALSPVNKAVVSASATAFLAGVAWITVRVCQAPWSLIRRHRTRKRITKAIEKLERQVKSASGELTPYASLLHAFIDQYNTDKTRVSPAFEAFKLQITRFALPKIDPASFSEIKTLSYIHLYPDDHYDVFYRAVMLSGFCNLYREFLAHDTRQYLNAIEVLIASFYHTSALKPHAEYIAEKVPDRDADYAIRYFNDYAVVIDEALTRTNDLLRDLVMLKRQNRFFWPMFTFDI